MTEFEFDQQSETDAEGNPFDPEIHSPGPHGRGVLTKKGLWRKKMGRSATGGQVGPTPAMPHRKVSTKTVDYRPGLYGIAQLGAAALMAVLPLDAAAVTDHAPPIVEALQATSEIQPGLASLLDKILSLGPHALLASAMVPFVIQILHNHDVISEGMAVGLGAKSKRDLMSELGISNHRVEHEYQQA